MKNCAPKIRKTNHGDPDWCEIHGSRGQAALLQGQGEDQQHV